MIPLVFLLVLSCFALGCSPGSLVCKWLEQANASVEVTDGRGNSANICSNNTSSAQAVESDAGPAPGFCDLSDPPSLDTDCSKCMKTSCCAELIACAEDAYCVCHAGLNTGVDCSGSPPDAYSALSSCYASSCSTCPRLP